MSKPRDTVPPQSTARSLCTFLAIFLGWLGIVSTWRLFSIGATVVPTILGAVLCGLLCVLIDRIWRHEGEYLKRYADGSEQGQQDHADRSNLRH